MNSKLKDYILAEEVVQVVAQIMGENSASTQAISQMEEMRQAGQHPVCLKVNNSLYVVDLDTLTKADLS